MKIKESLTALTKDDLKEIIDNNELYVKKSLRKAEMIEQIIQQLCSEEHIRTYASCLTKEQLKLLRKGCKETVRLTSNDELSAIRLAIMGFGNTDLPGKTFFTFDEIAEVFRKIDDASFSGNQYKKGWMMKCLNYLHTFYVCAPFEVLYKMYKLKVKCKMHEMIAILDEIPVCLSKTIASEGLCLGPVSSPLHTEYGTVYLEGFLDPGLAEIILREQGNSPFYIPNVNQIDQFSITGCECGTPEYKAILNYLMNDQGMPVDKVARLGRVIWFGNHCDQEIQVTLNECMDFGISFGSQEELEYFLSLLVEAYMNTRMRSNRGHTRIESDTLMPIINSSSLC